RIGHQRPADHEHLLLAAREIAGLYAATLLEPGEIAVHALDAGRHALPVLLDVRPRDQVLLGGQVLEDPAAFELLHDAVPDHRVRRQSIDPLVLELDGALGDVAALGAEQAGDGL